MQIAFLPRVLNDSEIEQGLVGVPYAVDGVAVIVHQDNPLQNISIAELRGVFSGENTLWDNGQPIVVLTRNEHSGVRDILKERVLGRNADFTASALIKHNGIMESTVEKIPNAIGYTSLGDIKRDGVKILAVEGVAPSGETLESGGYPLSCTLTFATRGPAKGAARAFLDFVKSEKGQAIIFANGYAPLKEMAAPEGETDIPYEID